VFNRPGECDLTANVDFAYLKEAMGDLGGEGCLVVVVLNGTLTGISKKKG
jgi:hypothetical protein